MARDKGRKVEVFGGAPTPSPRSAVLQLSYQCHKRADKTISACSGNKTADGAQRWESQLRIVTDHLEGETQRSKSDAKCC